MMQTHSAPRSDIRSMIATNSGWRAGSGVMPHAPIDFDGIGVEISYSRGAIVFTEGQDSNRVFLMHSGRVKLFVTSRDGKTMILRLAGPGEFLGLSAALSMGPYEVTAEAIEPCMIRTIHKREFMAFVEEHPEAGLVVARSLSDEYRSAFRGACRFSLPNSAAGRLAGFLLDWLPRPGEEASPLRKGCAERHLTMPLTHEEIASMTATTRETVSRTLQQFRRDKLISIKGSSLTLHRPEALEELCAYAG